MKDDPTRKDPIGIAAGGAPLSSDGVRRRQFLLRSSAITSGSAALQLVPAVARSDVPAKPGNPVALADAVPVTLIVNGHAYKLRLEPRVTLLDAVRERIGLVGTKKGCDRGQCGACTMLVNDRRINSCLALAVTHDGHSIVTVEGLASGGSLHPVQRAFIEHDGFQCGFCTPGQLCSAVGMLREAATGTASVLTSDLTMSGRTALSDAEIRERMSGNLCRCGAYIGIVTAIRQASTSS